MLLDCEEDVMRIMIRRWLAGKETIEDMQAFEKTLCYEDALKFRWAVAVAVITAERVIHWDT